jgi:cbb3-type cytochrome oxidase maturation protein
MDILFLLVPLSVVLVFGILGVFAWAVQRGQFDDLEREGQRILERSAEGVDDDQAAPAAPREEWPHKISEKPL